MNVDSMWSRAYSRDILPAFRSRKVKSNVKHCARIHRKASRLENRCNIT